ncbi:MAG: class I SAM-dependent methyltransferase [Anaerolineaceae bacterium]|nr:class I SAM-dependent methyltransferase [Anaerolineaceae bacterium]
MQSNNKDIQRFDREAGGYEALAYQGLFFEQVHLAVLAAIPMDSQPETIVDLGCGTGRLLRKLARRWPEAKLIGVDPAEGMIAEARRLTGGVTFYVSMAEKLPLADESAELVTSTVSFHHWQDQAQGLREVVRVLRPGGRFVLADFSMPLGLRKVFRHGRQLSPREVCKIFDQVGLAVRFQKRVAAGFVLVTVGEKKSCPAAQF